MERVLRKKKYKKPARRGNWREKERKLMNLDQTLTA